MLIYYYFGHLLSLSGAYLIPTGDEDDVDFESGAGASKKTAVSHTDNTGDRKRKASFAQNNSKTKSAYKTKHSGGMYVCMYVEGYKSHLCKIIISFYWFLSSSFCVIDCSAESPEDYSTGRLGYHESDSTSSLLWIKTPLSIIRYRCILSWI